MAVLAPEFPLAALGRPVRVTEFAWRRWTVYELAPAAGEHGDEVVFLHGAPTVEAVPVAQWRLLADMVVQARVRCLVPVPGMGGDGGTATVSRFLADLAAAQGRHRIALLTPESAAPVAVALPFGPLRRHTLPDRAPGRGLAERRAARLARRELISRLRAPDAPPA